MFAFKVEKNSPYTFSCICNSLRIHGGCCTITVFADDNRTGQTMNHIKYPVALGGFGEPFARFVN